MNDTTIDTITTNIAQISRRASLLTLGSVAIAALTRPAAVEAAKKPKKVRKKAETSCPEQTQVTCEIEAKAACESCQTQAQAACEDQARATREAQARACRDMVASVCLDATNPEKCALKFGECCDFLGTGDASSAVRCLFVLPT